MSALELRSVPLRPVALQLAAVVALLLVTVRGLDDAGTASQVLQGVAVLLAATLALGVDEPAAELLDATPTPLSRRVARRLAVLAAVVVPLWLLALGTVALRGADVPALLHTLQLAALVALALAFPAAVRRWRRTAEPGLLAGPLLVAFLIAAEHLPRSVALLPRQTWGPPWEVTHLRWSAVLLAAVSVLLVALSDPATARVRVGRAAR